MKTIFWNVDTQYDFIREDGKLPVPDAESIEGNLETLTKLAAREGIKVVNTADYHTAESAEISENPDYQTTFPEHCMEGTKGAEFIDATRPYNPHVVDYTEFETVHAEWHHAQAVMDSRDIVIYKDAFDVFAGNPHADNVVDIISPDRVIVYGVASNVCVDYAVKGLLERGIEVIVATDAIKGLPGLPDPQKEWERLGAKLTTTDEIEKDLGGKIKC